MKQELRSLILRTATGDHRTEKFEGRDHLVVPVVALVEGVIQAMNAKKPELVLAEKFSVAPSGWNGRPIFLNHPMEGSQPISGNSPEVLESSFGRMFNTYVTSKQMRTEAWIDIEKATELGGKVEALVTRIKAAKKNDVVEISVGAFITLSAAKGKFNGVPYEGAWDTIVPDHLALLEEGYVGACSTEMGCGVRAAGAYQVTAKGLEPLYLLTAPKGETLVEKLEANRKKSPNAVGLKGLLARTIGASTLMDLLTAEDMSDADVREELQEQLNEVEPGMRYGGYVVAFYPSKGFVIYSIYEDGDYCLYRRSYTLAENGDAAIADDKTEVNRVISYEPATEPEETLASALSRVTTLAGARHSSKDQKMVQAMHDSAVSLGADCAGMKASSATSTPCGCGKNHTALEPASW